VLACVIAYLPDCLLAELLLLNHAAFSQKGPFQPILTIEGLKQADFCLKPTFQQIHLCLKQKSSFKGTFS